MDDFTLTYRLTGRGWASATVSSGGQELGMSVSYISDALGDLVWATVALLGGTPPVTTTCTWLEEPGRYHWILHCEGEQVHLLIFRDTAEGDLLFETRCSLLRFVRQIKALLHHLREDWSEEGYRREWGHGFPATELQRLAALFEARKRG